MAMPSALLPTNAADAFVRDDFATKSAMYRRETDRAAPAAGQVQIHSAKASNISHQLKPGVHLTTWSKQPLQCLAQ